MNINTVNIYPDNPPKELSHAEMINLAAADSDYYMHQFFPKTARMPSSPDHKKVWQAFESNHRYINCIMPRGWAKTSIARAYTSKRIAYGMSNTIMYVGKSEGHAIRSIDWLKNAVDYNSLWSSVYGLKAGAKWQPTEAEIRHKNLNMPIWLMGLGVLGSVRGLNRDDFRPDLIVCDDILDEDNCSSPDQRLKLEARLHGAIKESLAPESEKPDAKLILLNTPQHKEDPSQLLLDDPEWLNLVFSCWTQETKDLPLDKRCSSWEVRYPSETLRDEKRSAIARNRVSIFTREKECKVVAPEATTFKPWLKHYDNLPHHGIRVMVIDPVPPPTENQLSKGMHKKDYECIHVLQRTGNDFFSVEYKANRGHTPNWTIATFFELQMKWRPMFTLIEVVAYQATLKWLIEKEMKERGIFYAIKEYMDGNRSKYQRIIDSLTGATSQGRVYVRPDMSDLITQFNDYPDIANDDILETLAIGVDELSSPFYNIQMDNILSVDDKTIDGDYYSTSPLKNQWGAP